MSGNSTGMVSTVKLGNFRVIGDYTIELETFLGVGYSFPTILNLELPFTCVTSNI